jgi:hypothetical protein
MAATSKIVDSGLHPRPAPSLEGKVLEYTESICAAFIATVRESLLKIKEAESAAIERLNEYVPTERLLTSKEAAAYLRIPLRSLHLMTCPKNHELPFNWISSQKRFRKAQLDTWLNDNEVKRARTKL